MTCVRPPRWSCLLGYGWIPLLILFVQANDAVTARRCRITTSIDVGFFESCQGRVWGQREQAQKHAPALDAMSFG